MPKLYVEKGKDKGKALRLAGAGVFLVGRDLKTHLRLRDMQASRRHLKVTVKPGEIRIEDLDSSNGTFVNGARTRSADLHPGDKIQVGETLIFFLDDDSIDETQQIDTIAATAPHTQNRKGELTGQEIAGYRVGRLLGRGGMGTVYEAVQISLERRVAFKVLAAELAADAQFVQRFTAEARAAGQLNHPNIVQVYDVGQAGGIRFYSMEFMARGSVEDMLRTQGKLALEVALPIVFDAARGLEYAERHGVVHRDIKPDNLMISEDEITKIGDLGIATRRRAEGEASAEEGVSGSPHYIAPEQALGKAIDCRADLYALGVSFYEMLSGDTPFDGSSAREVILKHINEPAPPLSSKVKDVAPEIERLIARLMEKDPVKRIPSASALLTELVPLVRQFPAVPSSRMRIDGLIAQRTELAVVAESGKTVPQPAAEKPQGPKPTSAELPETTPRTEATEEEVPFKVPVAAIVYLLLVVATIALGYGTFVFVRSYRTEQEKRHKLRLEEIEEARELFRSGNLADCLKRAEELVEKFQREKAFDEAKIAEELRERARKEVGENEDKIRREAGDKALAEARTEAAQLPEVPGDPEGIARLGRAIEIFAKVEELFAGTHAAEEAAKAREDAQRDLVEAKKKRDAREELEARARKDLGGTKSALDDLCKDGKFTDAWKIIESFERNHAGIELATKAAIELRKDLYAAAKASVEAACKQADAKTAAGSYGDAKALLKPLFENLAGVKELDPQIRKLNNKTREIDEAERSAGDARYQEKKKADEKRRAEADAQAADAIAERRFEDAAEVFDVAASSVSTNDVKQSLVDHAERLRAAAKAIGRVLDYVLLKKEASGLVYLLNGKPLKAFEAKKQPAPGSIHFRETGADELVAIAKVTRDDLHQWARKVATDEKAAEALLDAAALAFEVGCAHEAVRRDIVEAEARGLNDGTRAEKYKSLLR